MPRTSLEMWIGGKSLDCSAILLSWKKMGVNRRVCARVADVLRNWGSELFVTKGSLAVAPIFRDRHVSRIPVSGGEWVLSGLRDVYIGIPDPMS